MKNVLKIKFAYSNFFEKQFLFKNQTIPYAPLRMYPKLRFLLIYHITRLPTVEHISNITAVWNADIEVKSTFILCNKLARRRKHAVNRELTKIPVNLHAIKASEVGFWGKMALSTADIYGHEWWISFSVQAKRKFIHDHTFNVYVYLYINVLSVACNYEKLCQRFRAWTECTSTKSGKGLSCRLLNLSMSSRYPWKRQCALPNIRPGKPILQTEECYM